MPTSLLIVDDHRVFCQGLEAVFAGEPDFEPMAISHPAQALGTAYADIATALDAIRAGAVGFLTKNATVEQVISAVRAAVLGGSWLPHELLVKLVADYPDSAGTPQLIAHLTAREYQVLSLMVSGMDRSGIADKLHQSPNTVRTHIRNVIVKLGCHSAIEAVAVGLRAGLRPE